MDQGILRVRLYGDSLALPRPNYVKNSERYISELCSWWLEQEDVRSIDLCDHSKGSSTVADLYQWYKHDNAYYGEVGDVLIIHCGVVDCAPRPVPRWVRSRIPKLPAPVRPRVINFLHKNRAMILKRTGGWRQLSPQEFGCFYKNWLEESLQKFERIYLFNIAPTNTLIESHSPGFSQSIVRYNEIIKKVVAELSAMNVFLIDVHRIITACIRDIDSYIVPEDGHHLTALAHKIYCEEIKKQEQRFFSAAIPLEGKRRQRMN